MILSLDPHFPNALHWLSSISNKPKSCKSCLNSDLLHKAHKQKIPKSEIPLPDLPREAIALQILDAIDYAHHVELPYIQLPNGEFTQGKGLVHRDIKPSNILLTGNKNQPTAKLADFGLAKSFENAGLTDVTISGRHLEGTMPFMSREQVINFRRAQPEVDVWSVAACLYFMLTCNSPRDFRGEPDPLLVVLQKKCDRVHRWNPDVPQPLADLVDLALDETRELHFKTAKAFKTALHTAFSEHP